MTDRRTRSPRTPVRVAAVVGALAIVVASCSGPETPAVDVPVQNPDLVAAGDTLYKGSCAVCHGSDLRGTDRGPSHLSVVYQPGHHGDQTFLVAVRAGARQHHWDFGDMPPIEGLSDADVEAIVAFVRENQRTEGFEPYPP